MEKKIRKFFSILAALFFVSLIVPSAYATCGYIYYPGYNTAFDSCNGSCSRNFSCSGENYGVYPNYIYEEYHSNYARSPDWAGTSEYAWIPDPADP